MADAIQTTSGAAAAASAATTQAKGAAGFGGDFNSFLIGLMHWASNTATGLLGQGDAAFRAGCHRVFRAAVPRKRPRLLLASRKSAIRFQPPNRLPGLRTPELGGRIRLRTARPSRAVSPFVKLLDQIHVYATQSRTENSTLRSSA
jgi:hypothetical protein